MAKWKKVPSRGRPQICQADKERMQVDMLCHVIENVIISCEPSGFHSTVILSKVEDAVKEKSIRGLDR